MFSIHQPQFSRWILGPNLDQKRTKNFPLIFRKNNELLWIGRIATLTIALLSVAWIPGMRLLSDQVLIALAKVSSYTRPPIAAIFFVILNIEFLIFSGWYFL